MHFWQNLASVSICERARASVAAMAKIIFFANTEWYLYNFRLGLAKFLRDRGFEVVMVSPIGPYGPRLVAEGFRWIGLNMKRRSMHPLRELSVLRELKRIYKTERPDIVHHFTLKCIVYGSLVAWQLGIRNRVNAVAGMGYVFTSHEARAKLLRPLLATLIRIVVRGRRAQLIVQNRDDFEAFSRVRIVRPENLVLIRGSGIDTTRFAPA